MSTGREGTYCERTYNNILVCTPEQCMSKFGDDNLLESQVRRALLTYLVRTFPRNKRMPHSMPIHGGHGALHMVVVVRTARWIELVSLEHVREDMPTEQGRKQMLQRREFWPMSAWRLLSNARSLEWVMEMIRKFFG